MTMKIGVKFPIQLNRNKNNVDRILLEEKLKEHPVPVTASGRTKCSGDKLQETSQLEEGLEILQAYRWGPRSYRVNSRSKSQPQSLQKLH